MGPYLNEERLEQILGDCDGELAPGAGAVRAGRESHVEGARNGQLA